MRQLRSCRLLRKGRSASAALEFALAAPLLILFLVGVGDLGFAIYQNMQAQFAAEAGAQYAAEYGWDAAGIAGAVTGATTTSGITASPAPVQFCGCPGTGGVATVSCSSTCAGGAAVSQYVRVSATVAHTTLLPGIPVPSTMTAQSITRLQ